MKYWQTSRRKIPLDRPLVMGILNVTPDSFSDGGRFDSVDAALKRAEQMIAEGADIIDIGGESTRPGSVRVSVDEETRRVAPVIEEIAKHFDVPVSVDTSKSEVAEAAVGAGAEIMNDISGLRFDRLIADVAARHETGLVLMHSRGDFGTMHSQPPVENIVDEVRTDFERAMASAEKAGVERERIVLDVGIGFGKTPVQNLELIAKLDKLVNEFESFPFLVGTSRKSFIGKLLGDVPTDERLTGSLVTAAVAVWNGAKIVRVHDVKETVETIKIITALRSSVTK
ncbi:MAG TPA: dihydropteroate synthase [Pyrinomonadaceae bacterium]|nr:dihydropteroate synthase [Pyrinomonadaceae bacterium]